MPALPDVTTSEVTDPDVPDNESAGNGANDAEPVEKQPDGFAERDAKIVVLSERVSALESENVALRAHNYDLMMAAAPSNEPEVSTDVVEGNSGGVDNLFQDRG